jgi:hypothetical protein
MILTIIQNNPFLEDELPDKQIELDEKSNTTDSNNSSEEDIDDIDDYSLLCNFKFTNPVSIPFVHNEYAAFYFFLITSIPTPPPEY